MSNRHYYAEYCPYGVTTLSEANILCTYKTKANRDRHVRENGKVNSLTRKQALHYYGTLEEGARCRGDF